VDKRADYWAFGVVLYEMLTGRRAFEGGDVTEVLASVIKDAPSLDALPSGTPASVRRLAAPLPCEGSAGTDRRREHHSSRDLDEALSGSASAPT
jgi:serine/threonine-protein kinase